MTKGMVTERMTKMGIVRVTNSTFIVKIKG